MVTLKEAEIQVTSPNLVAAKDKSKCFVKKLIFMGMRGYDNICCNFKGVFLIYQHFNKAFVIVKVRFNFRG